MGGLPAATFGSVESRLRQQRLAHTLTAGLVALLLSLGCTASAHAAFEPVATTGCSGVPPISGGSVTLCGVVENDSSVTSCYFEVGTDTNYGQTVPCEPEPPYLSPTTQVTAQPAGLAVGTTYHYRLTVVSSAGTFHGGDAQFTTPGPSIATGQVNVTSATTATVIGSGDPNGPPTTVHAEYAPATDLWCTSHGAAGSPQASPAQLMGEGTGEISEISVKLTGLASASEYCAALVAENREGTSRGGQVTFTTQALPAVEGESVSELTARNAVLSASINPEGLEATYEFRLETPACEKMVGPGAVVGCQLVGKGTMPAGTAAKTVSTNIAEAWQQLTPNSTYRYFVRVKSSAGEAMGVLETFKTPPLPVIDGESITAIGEHDATLQAVINPEGQAVRYQFQLVSSPAEYATELQCPQVGTGPEPCLAHRTAGALPIGLLPAGSSDQLVRVDLAKAGVTLSPATTYHYRIIVAPSVTDEGSVAWESPPIDGADEVFATPSSRTTASGGSTGSQPTNSSSGSKRSTRRSAAHHRRRHHRHRHHKHHTTKLTKAKHHKGRARRTHRKR